MTPETFIMVLFGWSAVATLAYRWGRKNGFEEGRVQGRLDVVHYMKRNIQNGHKIQYNERCVVAVEQETAA